MSKVFIEESTLSSIGDAIREKNGTTDLLGPLDMATAITNLPSGGELNWAAIKGTADGTYTYTFDVSSYISDVQKANWMLFLAGSYNSTSTTAGKSDYYAFSPLLHSSQGAAQTRKYSSSSISSGLKNLTGYSNGSVFGDLTTSVTYVVDADAKTITVTGESRYQIGPNGVFIYIAG